MKCDKCDKDAIFQASMFLNGESVEVNLCADHYKEMIDEMTNSLGQLTGGDLDIGNTQEIYDELIKQLGDQEFDGNANVFSGYTNDKYLMEFLEDAFNDFKKKNIKDKLNNFKRRTQDNKEDDEIRNSTFYKDKMKDINSLRANMQFFVKNEMYEEAAKSRDEIKKINEELLKYRKEKEEEKNEI